MNDKTIVEALHGENIKQDVFDSQLEALLNKQILCKVYWNKYPGITYLKIPENTLDEYYTVIALVLDGPIKLFKEKTGAVELN